MIYGSLPAVVTGFLLTAIPNWTGRLPLRGLPLLVLVLVWAAGRIAVATSAWTSWQVAAVVDLSFLILVAAAAAREVIAGKNWRNLRVIGIVGFLVAGNAVFHAEAHLNGIANYGVRMGIGAAVMLLALVGGRVVPSFTRNWLARENPGRLPTPFDRIDVAAITSSGLALIAWIAFPDTLPTGGLLVLAGLIPGRAIGPLGRKANLARPPRPRASYRLWLHPCRLPSRRPRGIWYCASLRWNPRMDGRRC